MKQISQVSIQPMCSFAGTTFLAAALAVAALRNRTIHALRLPIVNRAANGIEMSGGDALNRWHRSIRDRIDQQIVRLFHCAIPSGLEFHDFDLSNLDEK